VIQTHTVRKRPPTQRPRIYDLYWYFAAERQAVFERRLSGQRWPWTKDPILQTYKFCNVFRAADRVSQYLIRDVAYSAVDDRVNDRIFQIVAFRTFSKIETWSTVTQILGHQPRICDLTNRQFQVALDESKRTNGGLYTGAFILCANNAFGYTEKHLNHIALWNKMFVQDKLAPKIRAAKSLNEVYQLLREYPLMGDFMSYQTAVDLNYSSLINFSENDFCQVGPGAIRGIKKAFLDLGDYSPNEIVSWMVERQNQEFKRLGLKFGGLWGRPLHAIDCQGLFCELDKYCRVAAPELQSERQRIKCKFSASPASLQFFFPPKWKINDKLPSQALVGPFTANSPMLPIFEGGNSQATQRGLRFSGL
jgi:hypothetical protein